MARSVIAKRSGDGGATKATKNPDCAAMMGWKETELPFGDIFSQICSLHFTNGTLYGGIKPAALLAIRDGGDSWEALRTGLPRESCYFTVLRRSMAGHSLDPAGIYFGTNSGSVFASHDEGDTCTEGAWHLPTILGLEVLCRSRR